MSAREFHIGDVLSVTTGKLVSPRHMDGIYDILNYMSGDNLSTIQLPRVSREAKPILIAQHPFLVDITAEEVTPDNWQNWLDGIVQQYGETLPVIPMSQDEHEYRDPQSELAEMIPPDRIITIDPKDFE